MEYLFDPSKGVPDQLSSVLGGYRKGNSHAVRVLRLICETIRHEKDRQYTSGKMRLT
jgi:hypothetical protein